ncbi:MAG: carboxymuconolactone decarboxylase family protein [Actinomycetota bacterium]|nr:carboxymuconolactone decarboxylase family protein [Actinomycetota bacterium]
MAHVPPLTGSELDDLNGHFAERYEATIGFTPNSLKTMARRPEIVVALGDLITVIWRTGTVPAGTKALVALMASTAAGCRYCQAHEAVDAEAHGVPREKVADIWSFETSPHFGAAERAALRFARDAAVVPNAVTAVNFDELREHFDDGQIVELLSTISLFGFLNRWNDSMATDLEPKPSEQALDLLQGWSPGKHSGP